MDMDQCTDLKEENLSSFDWKARNLLQPERVISEISNSENDLLNGRVSNSFEDVPDVIENLSKTVETNILKPVNSCNRKDSNLTRPSYDLCVILIGTFQNSREEFRGMYQDGKLKTGRWSYIIITKFRIVNNICPLNIESKRYVKSRDCLRIYGYCAHKKCNVFILNINECSNLDEVHECDVYSSSKDYNHLEAVTRYLKGDERNKTKKELRLIKASMLKEKTIQKSCPKIVEAGNLQDIKSDSVLRKARSEILGHNDRDRDDIYDMCLMQRENEEYIKCVGQPFHVYIFSLEQLDILIRNEGELILHLDSTGNVIRRPEFVKKRIFYYAGVIVTTFNRRVCPIVEMISCDHDTTSIGVWLAKFKAFVIQEKKRWPLFKRVVTDFSFALINSILIFWNNKSQIDYLSLIYEYLRDDDNKKIEHVTFVNLCCSHFFKMVTKDIDEHEKKEENRKLLREVIAACINFNSFKAVEKWFAYLAVLLLFRKQSETVLVTLRDLLKLCDRWKNSNETIEMPCVVEDLETKYSEEKTVYENSKFYQHFRRISDYLKEMRANMDHGEESNKYYNEDFFELILKKYMTYLPLWTGLLAETKRYSNAPVENWFSVVKNLIITTNNPQRCSRVLRLIRKRVLSYHKEIKLAIPKEGCTSRKRRTDFLAPMDDLSQKEEWDKKRKMTNRSNFDQTYLNKLAGKMKNEMQYRFTKHSVKNLEEACIEFLSQFKTDSDDLKYLEYKTRNQRLDEKWMEERKIRLTSSFFGRVCMATTEKSLGNIVKEIRYSTVPSVPAIKHGIQNEDTCFNEYLKMNPSYEVVKCGLFIKEETPFLGCSPDGLVNSDGLLEIKCPYSIKDCYPLEAKYLDSTGKLSKSHQYFYQIQGLLNISGREWCDFIVWTFRGMHVTRIYRDSNFWKEHMKMKLEEFYMFYVLPEIVDPRYPDKSIERRCWLTINENTIEPHEAITSDILKFPNGIVKNHNYYVKLERDYVIGHFGRAVWPELSYESYESINDRQWFLDVIINLALQCLITQIDKEDWMYLTTDEAYGIFNCFQELEPAFFEKLSNFDHKKLLMPLLVRRNHWCLAVADFKEKTFIYLDPSKSNFEETKRKRQHFQKFLRRYYEEKNYPIQYEEWEDRILPHIKQQDTYNCGAFIVYFAEKLLMDRPLTDFENMDNFWLKIRRMLLSMSDDMTHKCNICGSECENDAEVSRKCGVCNRHRHIKCSEMSSFCPLCRIFVENNS